MEDEFNFIAIIAVLLALAFLFFSVESQIMQHHYLVIDSTPFNSVKENIYIIFSRYSDSRVESFITPVIYDCYSHFSQYPFICSDEINICPVHGCSSSSCELGCSYIGCPLDCYQGHRYLNGNDIYYRGGNHNHAFETFCQEHPLRQVRPELLRGIGLRKA